MTPSTLAAQIAIPGGKQQLGKMGDRGNRPLYLDLVGRPPLQREVTEQEGWPRQAIVDSLLCKREFWEHWLNEQYFFLLLLGSFRPTDDAVGDTANRLAEREVGVVEALHSIGLSTCFDRRNPGPDTFVTVVMEQFLGLDVHKMQRELEVGKTLYEGRKGVFLGVTGNSQSDIVRIAMEDARARKHLLSREYVRLMRQAPNERLLADGAALLEKDPLGFCALIRAWFDSSDYDRRLSIRKNLSNRVFIRSLFVDLLDALPSEDECQRMMRALDSLSDPMPLRSLLAQLLLGGGNVRLEDKAEVKDPSKWIERVFRRFLGRPPTQAELASFLGAFADAACTTSTILYAIVSNEEYQSW